MIGTGRNGRVTKRDVLDHIADATSNGSPTPVEADRPLHSESPYRSDGAVAATALDDLGGRPEPLSRIRRSIGAAMSRSLSTAATCTTVVECDMTQIERHRRDLGLTALPLVARATVTTLREFPDLNARLEGDVLMRYERVHLGIAVSLDADGLIVPVIHDAQELSPEGLGRRIKDVAVRARGKQLSPDDVRGATFTITSPGAFGALIATPVIDVPQVAILDLEAIVRRPVVVAGADGEEAIAIRSMAHLCMSWDHRALDGVYAARFLTALRRRIESNPLSAVA
jgi:pyruvate/2-oxoglutarate dehydrogenase complex dihydrolipoamide acyltransferase (E2) component